MNFARCKCDRRATQSLMRNGAFALQLGKESRRNAEQCWLMMLIWISRIRRLISDISSPYRAGIRLQLHRNRRPAEWWHLRKPWSMTGPGASLAARGLAFLTKTPSDEAPAGRRETDRCGRMAVLTAHLWALALTCNTIY